MINDFTEKAIRGAVLNKIHPKITSKGKHWKGSIFLDKKLIGKVKIPNEHLRIMRESKSKYIAKALRLTDNEFNNLVKCPLKGPAYYEIQSELENSI